MRKQKLLIYSMCTVVRAIASKKVQEQTKEAIGSSGLCVRVCVCVFVCVAIKWL